MNFDNVSIIIIGLVLVSVLSLVYGNQEVLVMVVGGLLGFLAKDKATVVIPETESDDDVDDVVESEDDVQ